MSSATSETLEKLMVIQERDNAIVALRHQCDNLPEREQIKELDKEKNDLQERKESASKDLSVKQQDQERLEDEVKAIEERVAEQEVNLYGGDVAAIKDLQAIQGDIAGLNERKRLVEDQIIEAMEEIEPVHTFLEFLVDGEGAIEEKISQLVATLEVSEANFKAQIKKTEIERSELTDDIPAELFTLYTAIRSRPGSVGIAYLMGRTCKGCHLDLPAVEVDRLKKLPADELINCEECGCILVR
ncbi:MAG: C4-type zinc ribbon domain-containing protein [Acidimicrobiales bacterium]|nr:C4-type zinc ribbon domain-containing protein [Acidimicrobiales bacterium]